MGGVNLAKLDIADLSFLDVVTRLAQHGGDIVNANDVTLRYQLG